MDEAGPPAGAGRPPDEDPGSTGAEVEHWLARWRERLPSDALLPEDEARLVLEAVIEDRRGDHLVAIDRAGRAWGRAHRSVSTMVGRLSSLREAMAAGGVDEPLRMHRALDRLTAAATEEVLNRLERASRTDALTGVGNRRAFDETLSAAVSAASRQGHDVTVVAVDLDGLKRINDTEGHAAGDAALLALVRAMYSALRDEDTVFRVGGDEFVIVLPFTSVGAAELLMERIEGAGAPAFTWGAAGFPGDGADARTLVEAADADLYRRRQGRRPVPVAAAVAQAGRPGPRRPERGRRTWRWAWVPAAAVLLASLVATLATGASRPLVTSASRAAHHAPSRTGPGHQEATPPTAPGAGAAFPAGPGGGGGQALVLSASPILAGTSGPASAPPSSSGPAGPSGSGPSGPGPSGPAPSGGLLGTLEQLVSPVPIVGGNNGLLATLGQILTGTTYASPTVAGTTAGAGPSAPASTGGLLQLPGL
jgi:diguanylate cyclase (GGDEF)-like protein